MPSQEAQPPPSHMHMCPCMYTQKHTCTHHALHTTHCTPRTHHPHTRSPFTPSREQNRQSTKTAKPKIRSLCPSSQEERSPCGNQAGAWRTYGENTHGSRLHGMPLSLVHGILSWKQIRKQTQLAAERSPHVSPSQRACSCERSRAHRLRGSCAPACTGTPSQGAQGVRPSPEQQAPLTVEETAVCQPGGSVWSTPSTRDLVSLRTSGSFSRSAGPWFPPHPALSSQGIQAQSCQFAGAEERPLREQRPGLGSLLGASVFHL